MAVVEERASIPPAELERIQALLRELELDGWLLLPFHGNDPVAGSLLGLPAMTRRYAVLIPAEGRPAALTHRIEQQPWEEWAGEKRAYSSWRELESGLSAMLEGHGRVAMQYSPGDAVPYVDLVPAGVVEMVRRAGAEPVSAADLVSAFHARWTSEGLASHRRAAAVLQRTAHAAFRRAAAAVREGRTETEWALREWIRGALHDAGTGVGAETIVAVGPNAANPHYAPTADRHAPVREGDLLLIDLWGKEASADAVYADQTWMGYLGTEAPQRLLDVWAAVRDAREAAVERVRRGWDAGEAVTGAEVDDAARDVIAGRGWGEAFVHRTGHSIDRELHGSGPNIDNLETRDTRTLIQGVGFSVEPGIYLPGDVGFRSEVDVYMGADGPEVTTPDPQRELFLLLDPSFGG